MSFDVLSSRGKDADTWRARLDELGAAFSDIHFLPEYGRIYEQSYGYSAHLACLRSRAGLIVQPFVRRPLASLPFLSRHCAGGDSADIANAYGFGGPLGRPDAATYRAFERELEAWCEEASVASEFASLHPLMADAQRGLIGDGLPLEFVKDVVVVDLGLSESELLSGLRKGHRSSLKRAQRSGVTVHNVPPNAENVAVFAAIYSETMTRLGAASRWFFPEDFFSATIEHLGADRTTLFFAHVDGVLESAALFMHDGPIAYYHFAGSKAQFPDLGVNNLMVFEALMYFKRRGLRCLHLGGGATDNPEDTLLRFKAGFSTCRAPLYTYFKVRSRTVYDELCRLKIRDEIAQDGVESTSRFLPLYRR